MKERLYKLRQLIILARILQAQAARGKTLIAVDHSIVAQVKLADWTASVERAARKWETVVHEITLPEWKAATIRHSEGEGEQ